MLDIALFGQTFIHTPQLVQISTSILIIFENISGIIELNLQFSLQYEHPVQFDLLIL